MNIGRRFAAAFLLLSACQQADISQETGGNDHAQALAALNTAVPTLGQVATAPRASTVPLPRALRSCAAELGRAAAQRLADRCRAVSPATHPPCHPGNSCALIENEISRGCSMLGAEAVAADCRVLASDDGRAVAVVRRYYSAINARDFSTAYQEWGNGGQASGQSFEAFRDGFAATRSVRITVGSVGPIEGGAGSLFLDVPVRVVAVLTNGRRQIFTGTYSLRRVNDVDGAEPQQLLWHIASARLRSAR